MSHGGDGGIQPGWALALSDQKAQEHAKCLEAILGRSPPVGAAFLENKCPQPASIEATWLLSKPPEQLADVEAIVV